MDNLISVVIPTHNRPNKLRNALKSIFKQTVLPEEVLIVDDGSNPAVTNEIFEKAPPSIGTKLIRNTTSMGANSARNRGIEEANGDWIAFLDDDDEFLPNKIKKVKQAIDQCEDEADLYYHPAIIKMVNEGVSYRTQPTKFDQNDDILSSMLIKNCIGGTPMVVARRSKLLEVGLFDENLSSLQDYELWLRMAKANIKVKYIDSPLTCCNYITRKQSISKSLERNKKSIDLIENKYSEFYQRLSEKEMTKHKAWKFDMQIHKAYLNKSYYKPLILNLKALIKFKKMKYLFLVLGSFFGPKFIFKMRSWLQ